jgi:hypothetical protein
MSAADTKVEHAADAVERASEKAAERGGVAGKLADELAEDADFIRKLKPSLMKARAKGELPTDERPGSKPRGPSGPQLGKRTAPEKQKSGGGPNPFVVAAGAFFAGKFLAKWIDWRGHAHPRR